MSNSTKHRISLAYEHEGEVRQASAEVNQTKASITFSGLPSVNFQVSLSDPEQVILQLPTDRKGKKPTVSCDISSIPELEAAMDEVRRQGWLGPKVSVSECG
uniref:hypothetical protein n=1 Tax=Pseudomonas fluorescens TaxID=294 RepID=UPI0025B739A7|nr:hypothetical protein [Pseudomonas fluorescens]